MAGFFKTFFGSTSSKVVNEAAWSDISQVETENAVTTRVCDPSGNELILGESICEGGEGKIYAIPQTTEFLIKIYHDEIISNPVKSSKILPRIADMVNMKDLPPEVAWPVMGIYDSNTSGSRRLIGFAMKKMDGRSVRSLHYVDKIEKHFPGWNRKNLVMVAINFVNAVDKLHRRHILINDFNPSNFFVDNKGIVRFIDCDSYQVPGKKCTHYNSVHFNTHCAPELLIQPELMKHPRSVEHDLFGVAITIFQILMLGLHPYSRIGGDDPEQNLRSGMCPLGTDSNCRLPPGTWYNLWSHFPYDLKSLFITTFRDGHKKPAARATLLEWKKGLDVYLSYINKYDYEVSLRPGKAKSSDYKGREENTRNFKNYSGKVTA